jgi:general control protein GCN4
MGDFCAEPQSLPSNKDNIIFGNNNDLDQALAGDPWYPLFPQDDHSVAKSPLLPDEELEVSKALRNINHRSRTPSSSHSSISGFNKPLPPIIVEDPNDKIAIRRAQNTLAAANARSRNSISSRRKLQP